MRFITKLAGAFFALIPLAAIASSTALADGTLTLMAGGSSASGGDFECTFVIEYSGTVANNDVVLPTGPGSIQSNDCPTGQLDTDPGVDIDSTANPEELTFNNDLEFSLEVGTPPFSFRCSIIVDNADILFLSDGTAPDGPEYGTYHLQDTPVDGDACIGDAPAQVGPVKATFDDHELN